MVNCTYGLDDLKLNVQIKICNAKIKNKKSINWKPLLPTDVDNLDKVVSYLTKQGYKVNPNQPDESILVSWEE